MGEVVVKATIARWGNSLAVRLPKEALLRAQLDEGNVVDVTVQNGAISLVPRHDEPSRAELVAAIAPENLHGETFDRIRGAEIW